MPAYSEGPGDGAFRTTHWSVIRAAGHASSSSSREALEELGRTYWYPLYAYLRRSGDRPEDAADLVQGLFAELLARGDLARLDAAGGRFRSWLLTALRHHAGRVRERAAAAKRGGGARPLSIASPGDDPFADDSAERRYAREPTTGETPERLYERQFAAALVSAALGELRAAEERAGRGADFAVLEPLLQGDPHAGGYAGLAAELGCSEGALKVRVHRLRRRWRQKLVEAVARQVERPQDVEDELRALFTALSGET